LNHSAIIKGIPHPFFAALGLFGPEGPRSVEHLNALIKVVKTGRRAVLVFLIQRGDVEGLKINTACDPAFNRAFARARKAGVEFQALKHTVTAKGFGQPVPVPVLS
jgi:sugar fermentation stimulation protein A